MWAWIIFRLLPIVSQVFRSLFFYGVAVTAIVVAYYAGGSPLIDVGGFVITQPVAVLTATMLSVMAIVHAPRRRPKARFQNHDIKRRVLYLAELIRSCERELFMVTGELDHRVYDDPLVVGAFASLPETATVEIFITKADIDPKSVALKRMIVSRRWRVYRAPPKLGHVIIVDQAHVRIERLDGPRAPEIRYAFYEYGAIELAANVRRRVLRVVDYSEVHEVRTDDPEANRLGRVAARALQPVG